MKIVIFGDTEWSVGLVHKNVSKQLTKKDNTYEFIFHNQGYFYYETFLNDFQHCDLLLSTFNNYLYISSIFTTQKERQKIIFISHGISEFNMIVNHKDFVELSIDFNYAITSDVLTQHHPMKLLKKIYITPNGVESSLFMKKEKSINTITTLGWCGEYSVPCKQFDWSCKISKYTNLALSVAMSIPFKNIQAWYHSIDILLITSGPTEDVETGPLPPFEAIMSGIPVIGTSVGNFSHVPGPKFNTIDEAVSIINELKQYPERLEAIANEQYEFVKANYTYDVLVYKWNTMFKEVYQISTW